MSARYNLILLAKLTACYRGEGPMGSRGPQGEQGPMGPAGV